MAPLLVRLALLAGVFQGIIAFMPTPPSASIQAWRGSQYACAGQVLGREALRGRGGMALRMQAGEERELTPEECDILNLPRGTKLVGEMSEMMERKLTVKGKYEDTAALRYFGNEKIRASNYFGKKKLEVNVERMSKKIRRAEIEELMDTGMSYDAAAAQVDASMAARVAALETAQGPVVAEQSPQQEVSYVEQLFRWVDTDNSGSVTPGEMATAFQQLRGEGSDYNQVLRDVNTVLTTMDVDKDGLVTLEEFERAANLFLNTALPSSQASAPRPKTEEQKAYIAQLFAWVDTDGSGSVTPGEMATAFQRLRGEGSDYAQVLKDVNMLLNDMDIDKDGRVSLAEFQHAADLFMAMAEAPAPQPPAAAREEGGGFGFFGGLFGR